MTGELKRLTAKRAPVRGKTTLNLRRTEDELALTGDDGPDIFKLENFVTTLKSLKQELKSLDDNIILLVSDEILGEETLTSYEYHDKLDDMVVQLESTITRLFSPSHHGTFRHSPVRTVVDQELQRAALEASLHAANSKKPGIKLPQLELAKYDGDPLGWQTFYDQFEATIDMNPDLMGVDKMKYLISLLSGEAKRAIEGIPLSHANYHIALDRIKQRFGNTQSVVFAHVENITNLSVSTSETSKLRRTLDEFDHNLRCIEVLGIAVLPLGMVLMPMILSKFPKDFVLDLTRRKGSTNDWELSKLREMIADEVVARETAERRLVDRKRASQPHERKSTTGMLVSSRSHNSKEGNRRNTNSCAFCRKEHLSEDCGQLRSLDDRRTFIANSMLCYGCLKPGHPVNRCPTEGFCKYCNSWNHHSAICFSKFGTAGSSNKTRLRPNARTSDVGGQGKTSNLVNVENGCRDFASVNTAIASESHSVLLALATAKIRNIDSNREGVCNVILDSGSQRSYVTEKTQKMLKLVPYKYDSVSTAGFGSSKIKTTNVPVVKLEFVSRRGFRRELEASVIPTITAPIRNYSVTPEVKIKLERLELARPLAVKCEYVPIDVLIGSDNYYAFVHRERIDLNPRLVAINTFFGWIATGQTEDSNCPDSVVANLLVSERSPCLRSDEQLERFWRLEDVGVRDDAQVSDDASP